MQWIVAVTTSPRREPTIHKCLESLITCGWEPVVFSEPGSEIVNHTTVLNSTRLGVWYNWLNAVKWCLNTKADTIMTVQDDCLFHPESKSFVESILWPKNCGFVSLYTPKHYTIRKNRTLRPRGVNRIATKSLWGACALVWPREILEQAIELKITKEWLGATPKSKSPLVLEKRKQNPHLIANSDTAIGKMMNRLKKDMYFCDPSPVQHIARFSSISHGDNSGRRNAYRIADHSLPLKYQYELQ